MMGLTTSTMACFLRNFTFLLDHRNLVKQTWLAFNATSEDPERAVPDICKYINEQTINTIVKECLAL